MEIKKGNNKFYIGEDEGNPKAVLDYRAKGPGVIEAYHTLVNVELEGQGVAGKLFEELIKYAKKENLKIIPTCSYIERKMNKEEKYAQYIAK